MTDAEPLDVLIVEDEVLLAAELGYLVEEAGCHDVGHAMDSTEAIDLAARCHPDLALVDVHLSDGPTGVDVARRITRDCGGHCLFMTANVRRLPPDYAGACGVLGKPYSDIVVKRTLAFLECCLRDGRAPGPPPLGLTVAPAFAERWGVTEYARAS
jgi:CheY-like chemotaxis protein